MITSCYFFKNDITSSFSYFLVTASHKYASLRLHNDWFDNLESDIFYTLGSVQILGENIQT